MDGRWFLLMAATAAGIVALMFTLIIKEQEEWKVFSAAHECKVVAKTQGHSSVGTLYNSNGSVGFGSIYSPGSKSYLCNNGITYTRSN